MLSPSPRGSLDVLATVLSATVHGLDGTRVAVEIDLQRGLRAFHIVGLPSLAVRESRERVVSALQNCGFTLPEKRLTVNLAPADVPKEGAAFDLPIALGVLAASRQCSPEALDGICVLGELALDGSVRPIRGALPIAIAMRRLGVRRLLVPRDNLPEVRFVPDLEVLGCATLQQAAEYVGARLHSGAAEAGSDGDRSTARPQPARGITSALPESGVDPRMATQCAAPAGPDGTTRAASESLDFSQVFGQELVKRALAVAATGGHHVLMVGPPGVGKSMLARCLPGLLPPLSQAEALEVRQVLSVCGQHREAANPTVCRPFRAPHHTLSVPGLVGGGRPVVPGEITLAHHGVLFMDELPEFPRGLLDLLRQPLEEGVIRLARANLQIDYPARFQLVAAMNPCACGFLGHPRKPCRCTPGEVDRYRSRISGPILDRIDLRIEVQTPSVEQVGCVGDVVATVRLRERIAAARARQVDRYARVEGVHSNAQASAPGCRALIRPRREAESLLRRAMSRWNLSVRAYERTLAVARSIADLDAASDIDAHHVAEALQYRLQQGRD